MTRGLITAQHAIHQVSKWTPEVLPTGEVMLVDEQDILLEARVEVGLQSQFADDRVVVAVNVGIYTVHALEYLSYQCRERLREGDA